LGDLQVGTRPDVELAVENMPDKQKLKVISSWDTEDMVVKFWD